MKTCLCYQQCTQQKPKALWRKLTIPAQTSRVLLLHILHLIRPFPTNSPCSKRTGYSCSFHHPLALPYFVAGSEWPKTAEPETPRLCIWRKTCGVMVENWNAPSQLPAPDFLSAKDNIPISWRFSSACKVVGDSCKNVNIALSTNSLLFELWK